MKDYNKNLEVKLYELPDIQLLESNKVFDCILFVPIKTAIILGRANNPIDSLVIETVIQDDLSIYKRPSGGEAMVITPNMLVFAFKITTKGFVNPKIVFDIINRLLIENLVDIGAAGIVMEGISDLSIGGKKILGSSIYRNGNILFYHAVLNVFEPPSIFTKYLKHPLREPAYREGRAHHDFVTSLYHAGYINITMSDVKFAINVALNKLEQHLLISQLACK